VLQVVSLPVLKDNYSYVLRDESSALTAIIDPGEAAPIIAFLESKGWKADFIWNTHHHWDHVGGNLDLKKKYDSEIWCSATDVKEISIAHRGLKDKERFSFGEYEFQSLHIPGHTFGHLAFYCESEKIVFTGDTLFSLGCGKVFTGDYEKMLSSLNKISTLPLDTKIFSGHEYTFRNLDFLESIFPHFSFHELRKKLEVKFKKYKNTQGSTLKFEREWNPFLKSKDLSEFIDLRKRKDLF
jgi:hydroxyacylglutathione hydrolase